MQKFQIWNESEQMGAESLKGWFYVYFSACVNFFWISKSNEYGSDSNKMSQSHIAPIHG